MLSRLGQVSRRATAVVKPCSVRTFALMTEVNQDLPQNVLKKITESDKVIRGRHENINVPLSADELDLVRRKRVIYRSKQRGWLEADLLMGSWATKFVPSLSKKDLDDYEELLKEETIDIYNYISGKDPLPEKLEKMPVMKQLQKYALESKVQDPEKYAELKRSTNLT